MDTLLVARNLALALAIGLLIGIERGWRARDEAPGRRVAGLRTFGLLGLLGGTLGLLGSAIHPLVAIIMLAGAVAALVLGYARDMRVDDSVSVTGTIAGLITLCLGVLATNGYPVAAVAAAAVTALLLSLRTTLHGWLKGMTEVELRAVTRFALIAFAVLPLLPDRAYGPYDAWNPRQIWMVVVMVTGFSFAGYVANKRLGPTRGPLATAAAGATVSSTAVTAALAHRLREGHEPDAVLIAGIAIASAVMFLRVLLLTGALAALALPTLALVLGPAAALSVGWAAWAMRRVPQSGATPMLTVGNPFELLPALGFAALVAALALASRWAAERFGDAGLVVVLSITGTFDVDAAIVTMGGLPDGALAARTAGLILAAPVLLNTLFKAALAVGIARNRSGCKAALPLLSSVAAGLAALLLLWKF